MRQVHKSGMAKKAPCAEVKLLDDGRLHEMIALRAYELFEQHGCQEGHDCEDWLEAERQVLTEVESKSVPPVITGHAA